ncbi:MAG: InlB B-repeat-containing protein [Clostridia bacterium]|nr:InlB B-repeat-containing protein [Clostridia bacterium]
MRILRLRRALLFVLLTVFFVTASACSSRVKDPKYTVTFDADGGIGVSSVVTAEIARAPAPEKPDCAFEGWYLDRDRTARAYFPYRPTKDVTLYAKYVSFSEGNEESVYTPYGEGLLLSSYDGESGSLVLPRLHEGKPVLGIEEGAIVYAYALTDVYFYAMETVETNFSIYPYLQRFYQFGQGGTFSVQEDVLFADEGETLFCYPRAKMNESYTVPEGTKTIKNNAFRNADHLREITINADCQGIEDRFVDNKNLSYIRVFDNEKYSDDKGVLYEGGTLLRYPAVRKDKSYTLPERTESIADDAFSHTNIQSLTINKDCRSFGLQTDMDSLTRIDVESASEYFSSVDGVLYDREGTIIRYPSGSDSEAYTLDKRTKTVEAFAFCHATKLKAIIFPNSVVSVPAYSISDCSIENIVFQEGSGLNSLGDGFVANNGVLFSLTLPLRNPPKTTPSALSDVASAIFVPDNAVDLYRYLWRPLADKIQGVGKNLPEYPVHFSLYDDEVADYMVACVVKEPIYSREGYSFAGWYYDETYVKEVSFPFLPDEETTLYAKWNLLG